jgi:nucleoside-diphosphate-sugar epimerase
MHILLTGGTGYIASHIAIVLMQMEHEVVCGVKNIVRILKDIAALDPAWRIACLRYVILSVRTIVG